MASVRSRPGCATSRKPAVRNSTCGTRTRSATSRTNRRSGASDEAGSAANARRLLEDLRGGAAVARDRRDHRRRPRGRFHRRIDRHPRRRARALRHAGGLPDERELADDAVRGPERRRVAVAAGPGTDRVHDAGAVQPARRRAQHEQAVHPRARLALEHDLKSSSNAAGGSYCNLAGFAGVGNVVVHNTVSGSPNIAYANVGGQCTWTTSVIQPSEALGFVSTSANNFHITAGSQLRDAGGNSSSLLTDVDGESRPYGMAYDQGADEYHP